VTLRPTIIRLATVTLAVLCTGGCAGPRSSLHGARPLSPAQRVTIEFHDALPDAATDFCTSIQQFLEVLQHDVDIGTEQMEESLNQLIEDLDSYRQRSGVSQSDQKRIQSWLDTEFRRFLIPAAEAFYSAYSQEVIDLESRLLLRTALHARLADSHDQTITQATSTAFPASAAQLKGNAAVKVLDDAAEFIPVAGDAYGLFKAFVRDSRMESIKKNAHAYIPELRNLLQERLLNPLAAQLPTYDEVLAECRHSFTASQALIMLEEERRPLDNGTAPPQEEPQ